MPYDYDCTCALCTVIAVDQDDNGSYRYDDDSDDFDDDDDVNVIRDYSYKPTPVFHGDGPLYLGAEIEVATGYDDRRRIARIAQEHLGDIGYLKDDSSIGGGVEIVTHPMSYTFAMADFPWDMLPDLEAEGAEATESTGIHVHVSKAGFSSRAHVYKWLKFVYRNEIDVVRMARRRSDQWAPFTREARSLAKDIAKQPSERARSIGYDYDYYRRDPGARLGRYHAINITNPDTYELRMFASSLRPAEVKSTLAFASASVEYTRGLTAHDIARNDGWTWPAFTGWVAQRSEYESLHYLALEA